MTDLPACGLSTPGPASIPLAKTKKPSPPNAKPTVLLVEDLDDDVFFFKLALKRAGLDAQVHVGEDGTKALDYFTHQGQFSDTSMYPRPDLVFLDLKMPNMNGFEVLEWLARNPVDPPLKIYVLTGSEEPKDQARATELGALGYLTKPPKPDKLVELFSQNHASPI